MKTINLKISPEQLVGFEKTQPNRAGQALPPIQQGTLCHNVIETVSSKLRVYKYPLKAGIHRTMEFEKKGLAEFSCNVGTRCGHRCTYCSSPSLLRMHNSFKQANENPFNDGYAIIDPEIPNKVANDVRNRIKRGRVILCSTVDGWCPAAAKHNLGSRCLKAILNEPGWSVRILSKNAKVVESYDLIKRYRNRVQIGLTLTGTDEKSNCISAIEPNASTIKERMQALLYAKKLGLRTYSMFCPLIPGIASSQEQINKLVKFAEAIGSEEIFAEPLNRRGKSIIKTKDALALSGYRFEAEQVDAVRNKIKWSGYVTELISKVQKSIRMFSDIKKLRFLLYPADLTAADRKKIKNNDAGVIWL